jgi:hypothetical protein
MNDSTDRHFTLMRRFIDQYRQGLLSLDSLIKKIDALSSAIDIEEWKEKMFSFLSEIEQVNAAAINAKARLTEKETDEIENLLIEFEKLIGSPLCDD